MHDGALTTQFLSVLYTPLRSVKQIIVKKLRLEKRYYLTVIWAWLVGLITEILKKFQGLTQITAFLNIPKGCRPSIEIGVSFNSESLFTRAFCLKKGFLSRAYLK